MDTWINILTISICPRNVSIHMVIVLLYIYRFPKYRFDRFKSLSMWSQSDIFIFEITVNTDAVSFPIISYCFHFLWKNMKVKLMETFTYHFRSFSSLLEHIPSAKRDQKLKSVPNGATCYDLCIMFDPGLYTWFKCSPHGVHEMKKQWQLHECWGMVM